MTGTPPERLRLELARRRRLGQSFKVAFPLAVNKALSGEPPAVASWWMGVWFDSQRTQWMLGFSRTPWPATTIDLSVPDDDRSAPGQARPPLPIAV